MRNSINRTPAANHLRHSRRRRPHQDEEEEQQQQQGQSYLLPRPIRQQQEVQGFQGHLRVKIICHDNPQSFLNSLPMGYRFCPTDEELIVHYLSKRVANSDLPPNNIHEEDIYAESPANLTSKYPADRMYNGKGWYFFSPLTSKYRNGHRSSRFCKNGEGFWKLTGQAKQILHEGSRVGYKKSLNFFTGKPSDHTKTEWKMHEYATEQDISRLDHPVLCRVYLKLKGEREGMANDNVDQRHNTIVNEAPMQNVRSDLVVNNNIHSNGPCMENITTTNAASNSSGDHAIISSQIVYDDMPNLQFAQPLQCYSQGYDYSYGDPSSSDEFVYGMSNFPFDPQLHQYSQGYMSNFHGDPSSSQIGCGIPNFPFDPPHCPYLQGHMGNSHGDPSSSLIGCDIPNFPFDPQPCPYLQGHMDNSHGDPSSSQIGCGMPNFPFDPQPSQYSQGDSNSHGHPSSTQIVHNMPNFQVDQPFQYSQGYNGNSHGGLDMARQKTHRSNEHFQLPPKDITKKPSDLEYLEVDQFLNLDHDDADLPK